MSSPISKKNEMILYSKENPNRQLYLAENQIISFLNNLTQVLSNFNEKHDNTTRDIDKLNEKMKKLEKKIDKLKQDKVKEKNGSCGCNFISLRNVIIIGAVIGVVVVIFNSMNVRNSNDFY